MFACSPGRSLRGSHEPRRLGIYLQSCQRLRPLLAAPSQAGVGTPGALGSGRGDSGGHLLGVKESDTLDSPCQGQAGPSVLESVCAPALTRAFQQAAEAHG